MNTTPNEAMHRMSGRHICCRFDWPRVPLIGELAVNFPFFSACSAGGGRAGSGADLGNTVVKTDFIDRVRTGGPQAPAG